MVSFLVGSFLIIQEIAIFLLVFAILLSVLKNTKLITKNQNINIMIAFSISMMFQILRYYLNITIRFIQLISLIFVLGFLVMILSGWVGFNFKKNKKLISIFGITTIIVVLFYVIDINIIDWLWTKFKDLIFVVIGIYIIIKIITSGTNSSSNVKKKISKENKKPVEKKSVSEDESKKEKPIDKAIEFIKKGNEYKGN